VSHQQDSHRAWVLGAIVVLPVAAAFGSYYGSRDLLVLVYLIAAASAFAVLFVPQGESEDRFFIVLTEAIALSLLFSTTLMSPYISGYDMNQEFQLFQQVQQSGVWIPQISLLYNTALSVTVLPSTVSLVSGLNGTVVFKIIYPALYSIVPVLLYKIYRRFLNPKAAFLSVFAFLAYPASYVEITQLGREMVAETLLVMLVLLLILPRIRRTRSGVLLLVMFTFGIVVSHYSLALIFLGILVFSYILSQLSFLKSRQIGTLASLDIISISFVAAACWFLLVAGGIVFQQLSTNLSAVISGLSDFVSPTSRAVEVTGALGLTYVSFTPLHLLNRAVQYVGVLFVLVGFMVFVHQRRQSQVTQILVLPTLVSMGLLLSAVILPNLSFSLNLSRIYQLSLVFLSPCFYLGATKFTSVLKRIGEHSEEDRGGQMRSNHMLPAVILFTYLIFTSGWVWAVTGDVVPTSVVLDAKRMANSPLNQVKAQYYDWYIVPQDVAATIWLRSNYDPTRLVCADLLSRYHVLTSYGGFSREGPALNPQGRCQLRQQYVFLSYLNTVGGIGVSRTQYGSAIWPDTNTVNMVNNENRIYSDGATIYEGFG